MVRHVRPESQAQARAVIAVLRALVEHYADHPELLPEGTGLDRGGADALHAAVAYVGGMTDRFSCRQAVELLDWPSEQLPRGIDSPV